MRGSRSVAVLALLATASLPLLLERQAGTAAAWRASATTAPATAMADVFDLTAANRDNQVNHAQPADPAVSNDVSNEPAIALTNTATRHRAWIDVLDTTVVGSANAAGTRLLSEFDVDVDLAPVGASDCLSVANPAAPYWNITAGNGASGVGALTTGTTYPRTASPRQISGAEVGPGQTRMVCPFVRPKYDTSTQAGRYDLLKTWAGRQLRFTTRVNLKSFDAGTWTSQTRTVANTYQVKLPPPTRPAGSSGFSPCQTSSGFGQFRWAWPTVNGWSDNQSTPAMHWWEIMRQDPATGEWSPWRDSWGSVIGDTAGRRYKGSLNSDWINNDDGNSWTTPGAWVKFYVRGYPTTDGAPYVNSDFVIRARESADSFQCDSTVYPNTETGAHAPGPHGLAP